MAFRSFYFSAFALLLGATGGCGASNTPNATANSADGGAAAAGAGCPTTGYVGDQMCLLAPASDKGFQLHYGPSTYASATDLSPYLLNPGEESIDCYYEKTPNAKDLYVSGYQLYMRPGSHHLNIDVNSVAQPDGFHLCQANDNSPGLLGGSETPKVDEIKDPAPENQGLAVFVPANSQAVVNFHVINATSSPILREAWLNYLYIDPSQVKGIRGNLFLTGGLGFRIDPGTQATYTYSCSPDRPVRILSIAAHMHVHATRMSAWHVDAAGQPTLVYENFDWGTPLEARYDSVHTNTPSNRATHTPGATSGQLIVQPNETIQWECDVNNTSSNVLTFRNEVKTGEMCILTGVMVPADNPMNPYDFTCTRN
jgi:hypothetical protein